MATPLTDWSKQVHQGAGRGGGVVFWPTYGRDVGIQMLAAVGDLGIWASRGRLRGPNKLYCSIANCCSCSGTPDREPHSSASAPTDGHGSDVDARSLCCRIASVRVCVRYFCNCGRYIVSVRYSRICAAQSTQWAWPVLCQNTFPCVAQFEFAPAARTARPSQIHKYL